jgi:hypothetical protein
MVSWLIGWLVGWLVCLVWLLGLGWFGLVGRSVSQSVSQSEVTYYSNFPYF